MATREIRTLLTMDGAKEFKSDLEAAGRELRTLGSELKLAAEEFQSTGDKQDFLRRKSEILSRELAQQEEVVKGLEGALKVVTKSLGEGSKDADKFAYDLNEAKAKAEKMRRELKQTERELDDVGDEMTDASKDADRLGRSLRDDGQS